MLRALLGIVAVAPVLGFFQAWGALYLGRAFGVGQAGVGGYMWMPPLMLDLGAIAFGDFASRQRRGAGVPPLLLHAIAAVMTASLALLPLARTPWDAMTIIGVGMAGGGAVYTLVTADLLGRMPAASVSFAGGILAGAQSLSFIVVNPLIGRAVGATGDYDTVALALGAWVIPGSLAWQLWRPAPF
jgi:hypothetical protein